MQAAVAHAAASAPGALTAPSGTGRFLLACLFVYTRPSFFCKPFAYSRIPTDIRLFLTLLTMSGRRPQYWKPQTREELVNALFKQMQVSFQHRPEDRQHEWSLSFIRVSAARQQIDVGLSRRIRSNCRISFKYNPTEAPLPGEQVLHDDSGPYVIREKELRRGGPNARIAVFNMPTAFVPVDCDMEARAHLRTLLVADGVKLIPHTDNPKLD
jgi:hypothetical protein